jgi:DNA polymerase-3 subunit beta
VSSERGRAVKLSFSDGKVELSVINPDHGSAKDETEIDYDGEPIEIGFNSRYVKDIGAQFDTDTMICRLDGSGSPAIFQARDGASELYVLMPMRV